MGKRTYYRNRKLSIRQEFRGKSERDISTGAHLCNIIHPEISRRDIYVPFRPEKSIPASVSPSPSSGGSGGGGWWSHTVWNSMDIWKKESRERGVESYHTYSQSKSRVAFLRRLLAREEERVTPLLTSSSLVIILVFVYELISLF
jgi:hypothetical protein